jgi:hypothetical protein
VGDLEFVEGEAGGHVDSGVSIACQSSRARLGGGGDLAGVVVS